MPEKHPVWTRARVGRDRVFWVAYDDRAEGRKVVDQGYATTLVEADAAARSALAEAGMYRSRRVPAGLASSGRGDRAQVRRPGGPGPDRPREYLYTRRHGDPEGGPCVAAHLVLRKTPSKVFVTQRSCGPDQLGTGDESWDPGERAIALDRARLERDGSVYSTRFRLSDFYASREGAMGDAVRPGPSALGLLGLRAPCSLGEIKAAYRRRALEVHPDRGGSREDFLAVEGAYRQLLREAGVSAT
jgi:hypothetical protein